MNAVIDARSIYEEVEHALMVARGNEQRRLAAKLIGEPDDGSPTVEEAEAALAEAGKDLIAARRAYEAVDEETKSARVVIEVTERDRREAMAAVIRTSPQLAKLLDTFRATRQRLSEMTALIEDLTWALPDDARHWNALIQDRTYFARLNEAMRPWREAVTALEADPDAPLPTT